MPLKQKELEKVHNHEDLLDNDPFKDEIAQEPVKHIKPQKPTQKPPPPPIPQVEDHITNVPVSKIKELNRALKGHAKSFDIELQDNLNPLNHFTKTKALVKSHLALFRLGGHNVPPYRFFPCCAETACSRLMKFSDF